jgi:hypothetical protein
MACGPLIDLRAAFAGRRTTKAARGVQLEIATESMARRWFQVSEKKRIKRFGGNSVLYVIWWEGKSVQKSFGPRKQSPLYY